MFSLGWGEGGEALGWRRRLLAWGGSSGEVYIFEF